MTEENKRLDEWVGKPSRVDITKLRQPLRVGVHTNDRDYNKVDQDVMRFIEEYLARNQRPPTYREIGSAIGLPSTYQVYAVILRLEKLGFIERIPFMARSIKLTKKRMFT
jgi:hypothetical protein